MLSEVNFYAGINLYTVVLRLHGAVFGSLIVTKRLVQQVGGVCIERGLYLLAEGVAGVQVHVAHCVIVTVESCHFSHFVDEARSVVVGETYVETFLFEVKGSIGCMFG